MNATGSQFVEDEGRVTEFQERVVAYWHAHGRKELPWRKTTDPWSVLVAEILLRKTTARQVAEVFDSIADQPPVELARNDEAQLQSTLRPLGLYRLRAQQLQATAQMVAQSEPDQLSDPAFLQSLPGVGRYACNAVLCFAFGQPKPALDTNMIRVIERVFSFSSDRSRPRTDPQMWEFAEALVPEERCREYNWGILDLGNEVCAARNPKHELCPLKSICDEYQAGLGKR